MIKPLSPFLSEYEFTTYIFKDKPQDFFNWCLNEKLYRQEKSVAFVSRMKKYFENEIEFKGLSAVVVMKKNKAVGVALCEHLDNYTQYEKSWGVHLIGSLSLFIKPNYRHQGIASHALKQLEKIRVLEWVYAYPDKNTLTVPLFQAREKAFDLAIKNTDYTYVTDMNQLSGNYSGFIKNLGQRIKEHRSDEPYPMHPLRLRKEVNVAEYINETTIDYKKTFKSNIKNEKNVIFLNN